MIVDADALARHFSVCMLVGTPCISMSNMLQPDLSISKAEHHYFLLANTSGT